MSVSPAPRPVQLIQFKDDHFEVPTEAQHFLRSFKNPLGIVTIVGKYRTGKSLFLNKVLLKNSAAFKVCPTINSCTKGLWMWRQTIKADNCENLDILVIDSEGFGATEQTDAYNKKILLLALLLSSYFIYNSVGSIDETTLNNLTLIANLAKELQARNSANDKIEQEFPSFLWVVRDFTLDLVDKNGCSIQAKEYLEQALQIQKGTSDAIESKNKIRRMIKHFFKDRDCFTMVQPVETEDQLQQLDTLPDAQLRPEFVEQVAILRSRILKRVRCKRIKNKALDGEMLLELAMNYVEAINSGSWPNLDVSYRLLMKSQAERTLQTVLAVCEGQLTQLSLTAHTNESVRTIQEQLLERSMASLKQRNSEQGLQIRLYKELAVLLQRFIRNNQKLCEGMFVRQFQSIIERTMFEVGQDADGLQALARKVNEQVIGWVKQCKLPISGHFVEAHYQRWKNERYHDHCHGIENQSKEVKQTCWLEKKELEQRLEEARQKVLELELDNERLREDLVERTMKLKDVSQLRQYELGHWKEKEQELRTEITGLLESVHTHRSENEQLKLSLAAIELRENEAQRSLRQQGEEKKHNSRQLDITRQSLESKSQELRQLKTSFNEISMRLQFTLERESTTIKKLHLQLHNKTTELSQTQQQQEQLQKQLVELNRCNSKLNSELDTANGIALKQRSIYESMFESFRESLRLESASRQQLIQTNKNLSSAMKHMEKRAEQAEEKEKQLKLFKRCVKNASCLQCQNCSKFFVSSIFVPHLNVCVVGPELGKTQKQEAGLTIQIKQTLVKESDSKPYTEYVIEVTRAQSNDMWTINRKYKQFCNLNSLLSAALPGVEISEVSYIANPQESTKKALVVEERRKILEKYLNDLAANPFVGRTELWRDFIGEVEEYAMNVHDSPLKENTKKVANGATQSPEQFLRLWNQRNMRVKEASNMRSKGKAGGKD